MLTQIGTALFGWAFVRRYPFTPCFLLDEARHVRDAVDIPVAYIGGIRSLEQIESLVAEGFAFVQLGRTTVRDPEFVARLESGEITESDCDSCNRCLPSMSVTGVQCALSEREAAARP
jgi:2,4-dienoyl-CoA reductase-like NADH-dependent reductase (Old Yellow Enzyme family)